MKKGISLFTIGIFLLQPVSFVGAQDPDDLDNLIDGLVDEIEDNGSANNPVTPDVYVANALYMSDEHAASVNVCQSQAGFQGQLVIDIMIQYYQNRISNTATTTLPGANCAWVQIPLRAQTKNYPGTQLIEITVDPSNTITETAENNNSYVLATIFNQGPSQVQVIEEQEPDFYVKSLYYDSLTEKIEANFCQSNMDDQDTYFPFVSIQVNNGQIFGEKKVKLSGDDCYETSWPVVNLGISESGEHKFEARIDYDDQIAEENEQNNDTAEVLTITLANEEAGQQIILQYPMLSEICPYDDDYLIRNCGEFEQLRATINTLLIKMVDRVDANSNNLAEDELRDDDMVQDDIDRMMNALIGLQNNFPYTLEGEERERKNFIFEYTNYALKMFRYYTLKDKMNDFSNDML